MNEFILLRIIFRILFAGVCFYLAKKNNRNKTASTIFGFLFPIITLITLLVLKPKIKE